MFTAEADKAMLCAALPDYIVLAGGGIDEDIGVGPAQAASLQ